MPDLKGRFTAQERTFSEAFAVTGDRAYSAGKAGLAQPATAASKMLAKPAIQAEIARIQTERLFSVALPAAVNCLVSIITSDKAPAGARVQASKVVLDRTLGSDDAKLTKEPHEMTADEIAEQIAKFEAVAASRAKPIDEVSGEDVFA